MLQVRHVCRGRLRGAAWVATKNLARRWRHFWRNQARTKAGLLAAFFIINVTVMLGWIERQSCVGCGFIGHPFLGGEATEVARSLGDVEEGTDAAAGAVCSETRCG